MQTFYTKSKIEGHTRETLHYLLHHKQQNHHQQQQQPLQLPPQKSTNASEDHQDYVIQSILTLEPICEPGFVVVNHRCHKQA